MYLLDDTPPLVDDFTIVSYADAAVRQVPPHCQRPLSCSVRLPEQTQAIIWADSTCAVISFYQMSAEWVFLHRSHCAFDNTSTS